MEAKYIFALVILGTFFIMIFVSFAILEYGRVKEEKLKAWIYERYANKKINTDYDLGDGEEEIPQRKEEQAQKLVENTQVEEIPEEPYDKIDIEGIEEITGNYRGDK